MKRDFFSFIFFGTTRSHNPFFPTVAVFLFFYGDAHAFFLFSGLASFPS